MNFLRPRARYAHGEHLDIGGVAVRLRVDGRARRVSIRMDAATGEAIATAPTQRALGQAVAFATERAAWIAERAARRVERQPLTSGQVFTVGGAPCRLEAAPGRGRLERGEDGLRLMSPEGARFATTAIRLLKVEALRLLSERTAVHAAALGQPVPVVSLGDPKSRWGSCTHARRSGLGGQARVGRIRYSWRLILAPAQVLDYVAAHECAHLVEANHGPGFWALVDTLVAEPKAARRWLRAHGESLHAFGREGPSRE